MPTFAGGPSISAGWHPRASREWSLGSAGPPGVQCGEAARLLVRLCALCCVHGSAPPAPSQQGWVVPPCLGGQEEAGSRSRASVGSHAGLARRLLSACSWEQVLGAHGVLRAGPRFLWAASQAAFVRAACGRRLGSTGVFLPSSQPCVPPSHRCPACEKHLPARLPR